MDVVGDEVDKKAKAKTANLDRRKDERIEYVRTKKDEDDDRTSKRETDRYFTENFSRERDLLQKRLDDPSINVNSDRATISNYLEELTGSHEKLRKFLNDSLVFLRPYQLEQAQKSIIEQELHIMKKKEALQPRKKFAFKSKKKVAEVPKGRHIQKFKNTSHSIFKFGYRSDLNHFLSCAYMMSQVSAISNF